MITIIAYVDATNLGVISQPLKERIINKSSMHRKFNVSVTLAFSGQTDIPEVNNVSSSIHSDDLYKKKTNISDVLVLVIVCGEEEKQLDNFDELLKNILSYFVSYLYCSSHVQS